MWKPVFTYNVQNWREQLNVVVVPLGMMRPYPRENTSTTTAF